MGEREREKGKGRRERAQYFMLCQNDLSRTPSCAVYTELEVTSNVEVRKFHCLDELYVNKCVLHIP